MGFLIKGFVNKIGKIFKDQMPNDQNSWNDQKSVRWTVGAATYFFKNIIQIEMN